MSDNPKPALRQDFSVEYTYTRSTGPVIGDFLTALRDHKKILGIKGSDGRVIVPPVEFDPQTTEALSEMVEVGQQGEVVSYCWVKDPIAAHPLQQPFAWAMIQLDGADVPFIHCIQAPTEDAMSIGMRVQAQWAEQRSGYMTDISSFQAV